MSDLLLLLRHFKTPNVLFELALIYTMIILYCLKGNLRFFLQLSELIQVLENQVLHSLFVDFDFDLVFLNEVLHLSLFVA